MMAKKTSEFTLITTMADSDTVTGVQGGTTDVQISAASLKTKMGGIADAGGYFSTKTVEAALQQLGAADAAFANTYQPKDTDLTAIAALTTTTFGRSLLTLADAAAAATLIGAQPLDTDLSAIAALTTTAFGRGLLTLVVGAAARTTLGAQAQDADLDAIASLVTTAFGRSLLTQADAPSARTTLAAAPTASPTFTGTVTVPDAATATGAVSRQQMDAADNLRIDKALMTQDNDLITRSGGVPVRITRAALAADPAFTSIVGPKGDQGPVGPMAPLVVKTTAPSAADYGQPTIPLNAVWIVSP
jgi:hypothetical protein